jgi:CheY-like chemotaxis protein
MLRSCGITLLDTMNHLLDYAKINSLSVSRDSKGRKGTKMREMLAEGEITDLAELVEDVIESVYVGYGHEHGNRNPMKPDITTSFARVGLTDIEPDIPVLVTMDIAANHNWNFKINTGAWRRIVMNIFGNSLKYTHSGRIDIKLNTVQKPSGKHVVFCVKDTGIGMDKEYQKYKLFQPFAQENALSAGTGLGLCIVQQIVQQLGGTVEVQSERGIGTMISVEVPLPKLSSTGETQPPTSTIRQLQGLELGFIKPQTLSSSEDEPFGAAKALQDYHDILQLSVTKIATDWAKMTVKHGQDPNHIKADLYIIDDSISSEQTSQTITSIHPPLVLSSAASPRVKGALTIKLPLGPRKLANALVNALNSPSPQIAEESFTQVHSDDGSYTTMVNAVSPLASNSTTPDESKATFINPTENIRTPSPSPGQVPKSVSPYPLERSPASLISPSTQSPAPHHVLLVDDNAINLKILITLVKRIGCTYLAACNGLEAVQLFKASSVAQPFTFVFMDISMPVMDGFTATREIRAHELELGVSKRVQVIALTGLGSSESEKKAFDCGMDMFLTKPVSLANLKKLLVIEDPS